MLGLGSLGGDKAAEAIIQLALTLDVERDSSRLGLCLDTLARIGYCAPLEKLLREKDDYPATVAVEVLARIDGPEVTALFMEEFWKKEGDDHSWTS